MQKLSFKPWHGQVYEHFDILITLPDRKKRISRMIAPNEELALIKARQNHSNYEALYVEKVKK